MMKKKNQNLRIKVKKFRSISSWNAEKWIKSLDAIKGRQKGNILSTMLLKMMVCLKFIRAFFRSFYSTFYSESEPAPKRSSFGNNDSEYREIDSEPQESNFSELDESNKSDEPGYFYICNIYINFYIF